MALKQMGARVAVLDADIYGPSVPKMLGTPSRETSTTAEGDLFADRRALVALQQQSLDAESPDQRVRFLIARTSGILLRLGQHSATPTSLLN